MIIQYGQVPISQQIYEWEQPVLTSNGIVGEDELAVYTELGSYNYGYGIGPYVIFDTIGKGTFNTSNTNLSSQSSEGNIIWYTKKQINISKLIFWSGTWQTKYHTLHGSNDGSNWTLLSTYDAPIGNTVSTTWDMNYNGYYNYHKLRWVAHSYGLSLIDLDITATYLSEAVSSITFPTSFNTTNYSYSLGLLNTNSDIYATSKTINGLELSSTSTENGYVSYIAIGY